VHEWPHSRFGPATIAPPTHRSRVPLARRPRSSASAVPTRPLGMPLGVLGLGLGRGGAGINGEAKGAPVRKPGPRPPDCLFWFAPPHRYGTSPDPTRTGFSRGERRGGHGPGPGEGALVGPATVGSHRSRLTSLHAVPTEEEVWRRWGAGVGTDR